MVSFEAESREGIISMTYVLHCGSSSFVCNLTSDPRGISQVVEETAFHAVRTVLGLLMENPASMAVFGRSHLWPNEAPLSDSHK
jgi:hypothetical protein